MNYFHSFVREILEEEKVRDLRGERRLVVASKSVQGMTRVQT